MNLPWSGAASFVWQDEPGADAGPVTHWLIKAANGNGHTAPGGFDFAANYARWAAAKGAQHCSAWTWLYDTTDGATAARQLYAAAPHAPSYGCDVEGDDPGVNPALDLARLGPIVRDFYATLRKLAPGRPLWFTSYPSRAQAVAHGAPWDDLIAGADFGVPQVYFASQADQWAQIVADHKGKPVVAVFSPADWTGWVSLAARAHAATGAIAAWRYPYSRSWAADLARATATHTSAPTTEDDAVLSTDAINQIKQALLEDPASVAALQKIVWGYPFHSDWGPNPAVKGPNVTALTALSTAAGVSQALPAVVSAAVAPAIAQALAAEGGQAPANLEQVVETAVRKVFADAANPPAAA